MGDLGRRQVPPQVIIQQMAQDLGDHHCAASIRRDGRAVELSFAGVVHTLDVLPGFSMRRSNHYPVYSMPGADFRWTDASPQSHDALFSVSAAQPVGDVPADAQFDDLSLEPPASIDPIARLRLGHLASCRATDFQQAPLMRQNRN
jgi:hypothetical protein